MTPLIARIIALLLTTTLVFSNQAVAVGFTMPQISPSAKSLAFDDQALSELLAFFPELGQTFSAAVFHRIAEGSVQQGIPEGSPSVEQHFPTDHAQDLRLFRGDIEPFTHLTPEKFTNEFTAWLMKKQASGLRPEQTNDIHRFADLLAPATGRGLLDPAANFNDIRQFLMKKYGVTWTSRCGDAMPYASAQLYLKGFWRRMVSRPNPKGSWPIQFHRYVEVRVAGEWLLIDLVAEQFEKREMGIVIMPVELLEHEPYRSNLPWYTAEWPEDFPEGDIFERRDYYKLAIEPNAQATALREAQLYHWPRMPARVHINSESELLAAYEHPIGWPATETTENFEFDRRALDLFEHLQRGYDGLLKHKDPSGFMSALEGIAILCGQTQGHNFYHWAQKELAKSSDPWTDEDYREAAEKWLAILNRDFLVPQGWFIYLGPRGVLYGHVDRYDIVDVPFMNTWRLVIDVDHTSDDILPAYSQGAMAYDPYIVLSRHLLSDKAREIHVYAVEKSQKSPKEYPVEVRIAGMDEDSLVDLSIHKTIREEWNHTVDDLRLELKASREGIDTLSAKHHLELLDFTDGSDRAHILNLLKEELEQEIKQQEIPDEDVLDLVSEAHNTVREFTDPTESQDLIYSLWRLKRIYQGIVGRRHQSAIGHVSMPHEIGVRAFLSVMAHFLQTPVPAWASRHSSKGALDEMIRLDPEELWRFLEELKTMMDV